jgi:hypothetical protein
VWRRAGTTRPCAGHTCEQTMNGYPNKKFGWPNWNRWDWISGEHETLGFRDLLRAEICVFCIPSACWLCEDGAAAARSEVRTRRKPSLGSMLRLGGRPNRICEFWRDRRKAAGAVRLLTLSSGTDVLSGVQTSKAK